MQDSNVNQTQVQINLIKITKESYRYLFLDFKEILIPCLAYLLPYLFLCFFCSPLKLDIAIASSIISYIVMILKIILMTFFALTIHRQILLKEKIRAYQASKTFWRYLATVLCIYFILPIVIFYPLTITSKLLGDYTKFLMIFIMAAYFYIKLRLILTFPEAATKSAPIQSLKNSWKITKGHIIIILGTLLAVESPLMLLEASLSFPQDQKLVIIIRSMMLLLSVIVVSQIWKCFNIQKDAISE